MKPLLVSLLLLLVIAQSQPYDAQCANLWGCTFTPKFCDCYGQNGYMYSEPQWVPWLWIVEWGTFTQLNDGPWTIWSR
jgi:hypothetical protein